MSRIRDTFLQLRELDDLGKRHCFLARTFGKHTHTVCSYVYGQITPYEPVDMDAPPRIGEGDVDPGIHVTMERLRQRRKGRGQEAVTESLDKPVYELEIPLCRMIPMTEVRGALAPDIEKLKSEFAHGYRLGSSVFYVATRSYTMETQEVTEEQRGSWDPIWREAEKTFEERLKRTPGLEKYSNKMFYIWDGNHRHKAWSRVITDFHSRDPNPAFHPSPKTHIICVTEENKQQLLHAMTQWNK